MRNLVTILLLTIHFAYAQPISKLINQVLEENLELKALKNDYLAALEKAPQIPKLPDPEIGIGVFPLPVQTRLGAQTVRASATQMIPWFGMVQRRKDLENAKASALYELIAAKELEVRYKLQQNWYQLYEIRQSQAIFKRNLVLLAALERLALTKMESGKGNAAQVLQVQLKIENWKKEIEIWKTRETIPIVTINQLLNRDLQTPIQTTDTLAFAQILFQKDSLIALISNNHPMLRMIEVQQETARQAIALNQINSKPSFGIGADYIWVNERTDATFLDNGRDILQLKATVKIPLYRKQYEAKEKEENFKIAALEERKTDSYTSFLTTIEQAYTAYEIAAMRLELYQKQITITDAAITILESAYSADNSSFVELLQLETELIDYDLKKLKAIVESHLAKSMVERFVR